MEREKRNNFQRVLVYHYHHDAAVFAADIGVTHNLASIVEDSTEKFDELRKLSRTLCPQLSMLK
jgi:hypothetical protein